MPTLALLPQLLTRASQPPNGVAWLHEIKYDGYRLLASTQRGKVWLYSRSGGHWTAKLPWIANAVSALNRDVHFDGELVYLCENGCPDFDRLRAATQSGAQARLYYQVFDLLRLDGRDLTNRPLLERKQQLSELLGCGDAVTRLRYASHFEGDSAEFFRAADRLGLEGIVSKRVQSSYRPGMRASDWIKTKCFRTQRFTVVGYTTELVEDREVLATLALAAGDRYVGRVEFGVPRRDESLLNVLRALGSRTASVAEAPQDSSIHWVRPLLAADVRCLMWQPGQHVRHAVLRSVTAVAATSRGKDFSRST